MTNLPTLYELSAEYRSVAERLADMEANEEVIRDTLESISAPLQSKAENVSKFILHLEASAAQIQEAADKMGKRARAIENRAKSVRAYLLENMIAVGINEIECPYFKLAIRNNNNPSVAVDNASLVPKKFMRRPEPPPPVPDKTAIAESLKAGKPVPGCRLVHSKRLDIK